jgi:hypothetical protein
VEEEDARRVEAEEDATSEEEVGTMEEGDTTTEEDASTEEDATTDEDDATGMVVVVEVEVTVVVVTAVLEKEERATLRVAVVGAVEEGAGEAAGPARALDAFFLALVFRLLVIFRILSSVRDV